MQLYTRCRFDVSFEFVFIFYLNFTLTTVDNIYHIPNVSSNRNETLTVTYSHSAETVEFGYGFKLLRLALRFHIFSCRYRVNATPKRKNFVPFSNSAGVMIKPNGFCAGWPSDQLSSLLSFVAMASLRSTGGHAVKQRNIKADRYHEYLIIMF